MKIKFPLFILFISFLSLSNASLGQVQAPNLGTASAFALFTAAGAFTNNGASVVTGEIGTNIGALTGFPPGIIIGQIYVQDATTAQVATDVHSAYTSLSGSTCSTTIGVTLGNDQLLTPGIYCAGAASTLNGTLTLDGEGNPDALFIIKIDGGLVTTLGSQIVLTNQASLNNVYFHINGEVHLGVNSVFKGTIINNGAINLLEDASLLGRALSTAGAIILNENTVTLQPVSLPVEMTHFAAIVNRKGIILSWATASETNNDRFEVQRSADGTAFQTLTHVKGQGTSTSGHNYTLVDKQPLASWTYYRLCQVDTDGTRVFSSIAAALWQACALTAAYPNPSTGLFMLPAGNGMLYYHVFNMEGQTVQHGEISGGSLNLTQLRTGTYLLELTGDFGRSIQRLVRQ